ncbi:MAG: hypothetical protein IJL99_04500 [Firmicutes bacterium]|nr:hypothetical protein [Bacillota bacterium]
MKVYCLVGKSGTGKSYQAINLCRQMNIVSIIDDGLFICHNKVVAGISAKRQKTQYVAVKTALFDQDWHAQEVIDAIKRENPENILVLGTSDRMVEKIRLRLQLDPPVQTIYIEDITTEEEREIAYKQRHDLGKHVIPAPTFQLKKQFSGYFMSPLKMLKEFGSRKVVDEKSVVRPAYSYLGKYNISEKVMGDIVECIKDKAGTVYNVDKVLVTTDREGTEEGIGIYVLADLNYDSDVPANAKAFQKEVYEQIEHMTAFNVMHVDLEIRDVV